MLDSGKEVITLERLGLFAWFFFGFGLICFLFNIVDGEHIRPSFFESLAIATLFSAVSTFTLTGGHWE